MNGLELHTSTEMNLKNIMVNEKKPVEESEYTTI